MPKKYRNPQGEMLYTFAWEGGGGNTVNAINKAQARRRAIAFGKGLSDSNGRPYDNPNVNACVLVPNMDSLGAVNNFQEYLDFDRGLAMMAW